MINNTKLKGIKSALSDWKQAAEINEPKAIYLDIPTGSIYTDNIINPLVIGLRIDNICLSLYGNVSMDTLRRYCDTKIYGTAILLDVDNTSNPIYSNELLIDGYVAFGGPNFEPQIQQIHIGRIGEDRANKFIQCADWIFDQQIEIDCAENRIDTMTAHAYINMRPNGKYTHQIVVTSVDYKEN